VRWLGPGAGPADLSLASLAAYQRELAERGLSSQTVRKDRAALNAWLRWLAEHELVDPRQARLALSVQLPRAEVEERERPHALSDEQYCRLVAQAEATVARDPLLGWHDVAIVRVVAEAGLRCEELIRLERRTSSRLAAALSSARLRSARARAIAVGGCDSRRRRRRPCSAGTASAEARTRCHVPLPQIPRVKPWRRGNPRPE